MICPNYGRQNGYGTNLLKCEPDSVILCAFWQAKFYSGCKLDKFVPWRDMTIDFPLVI
jgi:hypothetical protein